MNRSRAVRLPAALLIAVALLAAPALAGCSAIPAIPLPGIGDNGGSGEGEGSDDGQTDGAELPADFPTEVPLYDGEIVAAGGIEVEGAGAWNVTIAVPDREAYLAIEEQFAAAGFEHEEFLMSDSVASINFQKAPFAAMVILSSDGANWIATYQVTKS
jgi:hypothetical protein